MKECSSCGQKKPLSEFQSARVGVAKMCSVCRVAGRRRFARHAACNPDLVKTKRRAHRHGPGRAKYLASLKRRYADPVRRAAHLAHQRTWRRKNRGTVNAQRARWEADRLRATPAWADQDEIRLIYMLAALESRLTGRKIQVDHVVPLRNKFVCGLHCPANFALVEGEFNSRKSNKTWPGMP